ncbi:MAG: response regulator [Desulfobulbus sp.]|nr:response regulator [Desulfobulbus sp.]
MPIVIAQPVFAAAGPHDAVASVNIHVADPTTIAGLVVVVLLILTLIILNQRKKSILSNTSKALEETEARYRLLFEHSPIALVEEDLSTVKTFLDQLQAQGLTNLHHYFADNPESLARCAAMVRIIDASRAALALYGAATPESLGQLTSALPTDHLLQFKKEILGLIKDGRSKIVLENRTLNGDMLTVERQTVVAAGFEQSWRQVFVTITDITEQVRLRNENKHFEKKLQQTQKLEAIGSLAGGIAHDFNNILAPIMNRAELMLADNADNEHLCEHCQCIVDAAKRARELVKQILTFSRQVDQEITPVSLVEIIREVIGLVRPSLPATIEIECDLIDQRPLVMADAIQLHQVIMNLATNAFHAMEDQGGFLRFRLGTVTLGHDESIAKSIAPGLYVQLRVEDTGHGMDKATMGKIFDPYFTTKPRDKGTGLGLAIVVSILRGYGGEIWAESEVGKGTTFILYFPVVQLAARQPLAECAPQEPLPRGTEHILLVDDEKSIADVTTTMLEFLGYKVTVRLSSYDALEAFRSLSDRIDLLIVDLTMPQMTGLQLYRKIKNIRPDIKVIICTGFSEQLDGGSARSIGIEGFLHKPVVLSDLARCVRSVLDG